MAAEILQSRTLGHTVVFTTVSMVSFLAVGSLGGGSTTLHLILLTLLLPFLGIPHGSLDYILAKKLFYHRYGRSWSFWFLSLYLFVTALVLSLWLLFPAASLAAFFTLTLFHFGTGDTLLNRRSSWPIRVAEALSRGGTVLTFPVLFDRENVMMLLSFLAPSREVHILIQALAYLSPAVGVCLIVCLLWSGYHYRHYREDSDLGRLIELIVIPLLFGFLPALLAFTIYFNFLHSVRHMLAVAAGRSIGFTRSWWSRAFLATLPVTAATLLMGAGAYIFLTGAAFEAAQWVRVIFIGIASMTYPHVAVVWMAERAERHRRLISPMNVPVSP